MALSKRDQKTLTITVVLLMGTVVWLFGIEPLYNQYTTLIEDVDEEQQEYVQNQEILAEAESINEGYARVEAQFPKDDPERDPSEAFNEEVVDLVEEQIGVIPEYSPPTTAEIKGATGYQFLILPVSVKTTIEKAASLLREIDERGYLIQTAQLTRDANLDSDEITVELNLGRIVKIVEEEEIEPRLLRRGGN